LAVLSDAAHLAADLSAFIVAISGSHIASLPASDSHTFGLKRTESLAALFSMVSLAILSVGLGIEAIRRGWIMLFTESETTEVDGKLMSTIAFIGVLVNVVLAYVLGEDHVHMVGSDDCHHGHDHGHDHGHHDGHNHSHGHSKCGDNNSNDHPDGEHSHAHGHDEESNPLVADHSGDHSYSAVDEVQHLDEVLPKETDHSNGDWHKKERNVNLHAAYLHVLADLAQSVVVLIAGLIIYIKPTWQLADPICTLIFSILVCYSTVGVIRSSLSVLLEEVPPGVNWEEIFDAISAVEGVSHVHDLHIWSISHGNYILSVHATAENSVQAYKDIRKVCNQRNISHLTVQLQPSDVDDCLTCMEDSVHQCR
jgi:zinc transporter 2